MTSFLVGIDIGGSHIAVGFVNKQQKLVDKDLIQIDDRLDPQKSIEILSESIEKVSKRLKLEYPGFYIEGIGIGCPGNALTVLKKF
jgi:predicted NBD/HSP70 family sugar kinase